MNALIILFSDIDKYYNNPLYYKDQKISKNERPQYIENYEKIYLVSEKNSQPFSLDGIVYRFINLFNFINNNNNDNAGIPINYIASTLIHSSYDNDLKRTTIHPCSCRQKFSYKYEYEIKVLFYNHNDWIIKINGGQETSMRTLQKNINEISYIEKISFLTIINKFIYNNGPCKTCLVNSVCCDFSKKNDLMIVKNMCDEVKSIKKNFLEQKIKEIPPNLQQYLR